MVLLYLVQEGSEYPYCYIVSPVVIIAVAGEISLCFVMKNNAVIISYRPDLCIFDSAEGINNV